jgi:hypothetical protein
MARLGARSAPSVIWQEWQRFNEQVSFFDIVAFVLLMVVYSFWHIVVSLTKIVKSA